MPNIFKALATTAVWAGFVGGWVMIIISTVDSIILGTMWNPGAEHGEALFGWMVWGGVSLFLSVVGMKLRKMLE